MCHLEDDSKTSTRADSQNASVVRTLFDLFFLIFLSFTNCLVFFGGGDRGGDGGKGRGGESDEGRDGNGGSGRGGRCFSARAFRSHFFLPSYHFSSSSSSSSTALTAEG